MTGRLKGFSAEDRFWPQVLMVENCWQWIGTVNAQGYGHFWGGDKPRSAHRWAYEHFRGPIPEGLEIDHLCRNPGCVNPEHLEPVTPKENMRRGIRATRTHCLKGHEYTPENTRRNGRGTRVCRTCALAFQSRWAKQKRLLAKEKTK